MSTAIDSPMEATRRASFALASLTCLCIFALRAAPASFAESSKAVPADDICRPPDGPKPHGPCNTDHNRPEHGSLANIGAKLNDPTSDVWALQFNFQGPQFFDGDLNLGSPEVGGNVIFQPILPFPLYGTGTNQWKMITRPIVPIIFSQPIPQGGLDEFKSAAGIGDIEIPLLINLPTAISGQWIIGAGPVFEFPTATPNSLGAQQYSVGPAVVFGYKTKKWTAVVFPNYFFGVGSRGDRNMLTTPTTSKLSMLYAFWYNLPNAWEIGFNPTISYNNNSSSGNQWDIPVAVAVAKTIRLGRMPFKIQGALEYSVVSPNEFGKRAAFRFVITPVIPGLVQNPIFGGK
jgi:hypothetical protein